VQHLFIDGNNLGIRSSFANGDLSVSFIDFEGDFDPDAVLDEGSWFPTGAIHGFMTTLAMYRGRFPQHYIAVVWDAGHAHRNVITAAAVQRGVVPAAYKENRRGAAPQAVLDFVKQKPVLQKMISCTNIPQIVVPCGEADDVVASYVRKYAVSQSMVATNDQDYYQLLGPDVVIVGSGDAVFDESWFRARFGISPAQWVEVGAMQGDDGDNIFGVPGWGEKTSVKEIARVGTAAALMAEYHSEFDCVRASHPDLDEAGVAKLAAITVGGGKPRPKYPDIQPWMPFTGVAMAKESGDIKIPQTTLNALIYEERIPLAKTLKAMRSGLKVPDLPNLGRDRRAEFESICSEYRLATVASSSFSLCGPQPT